MELQLQRESIYNEVDRLESETELRAAIFALLIFLIAVAASQSSGWLLLAEVLPLALLAQGVASQTSADRRVMAAVIHGTITSPTIEALRVFEGDELVGPPASPEPPSRALGFAEGLLLRLRDRRALRRSQV